MKKIMMYVFGAAIAIAASKNGKAQEGWSISLKAVPHASWTPNESDDKIQNFERKTLFHAAFGIGTAYNFSKRSGVGLDVLYSMQGQKYQEDGLEFTLRNNYLKLPLTYHYVFNPNSKVALIGKLGPQLSIATSGKIKKDDKVLDDDTKECLADVTFGGVAGLTSQFRLSKQWFLQAGLRYDYDFTNAENEDHPHHPASRKPSHNTTLGLEVGLKFAFN